MRLLRASGTSDALKHEIQSYRFRKCGFISVLISSIKAMGTEIMIHVLNIDFFLKIVLSPSVMLRLKKRKQF
jgi:hypothetical protein